MAIGGLIMSEFSASWISRSSMSTMELREIEESKIECARRYFANIATDFKEIKRHLISFFRSTQRMHLEDKKPNLKIRTKDGKKPKTSFRREDWDRVSRALGKISWLCLLYCT